MHLSAPLRSIAKTIAWNLGSASAEESKMIKLKSSRTEFQKAALSFGHCKKEKES